MRRNNEAASLYRSWESIVESVAVPNGERKRPPTSGAAPKRPASPLRVLPGGAERTLSDEALVDAVQRGDQRVAQHLYDRLYPVVDRTLYRIFGKREADHDDLMQAAFEQIVVTLGRRTYAGDCSLKTWAASITSHVAFNALRSRRRERRLLDRGIELDGDNLAASTFGEDSASARLELNRVQQHLLAMKPEQAEALFLCDVLDHKLAEVARLTHVSVAAATSRLVRGRRELHRRLAAERKAERFR
ncbi:MAG TPA: RNA polymerase sigma factor [Polyangiaceae bacterium]|nr:RNA polymerase sigma factor [Polyangiaceae bacterium]